MKSWNEEKSRNKRMGG